MTLKESLRLNNLHNLKGIFDNNTVIHPHNTKDYACIIKFNSLVLEDYQKFLEIQCKYPRYTHDHLLIGEGYTLRYKCSRDISKLLDDTIQNKYTPLN